MSEPRPKIENDPAVKALYQYLARTWREATGPEGRERAHRIQRRVDKEVDRIRYRFYSGWNG